VEVEVEVEEEVEAVVVNQEAIGPTGKNVILTISHLEVITHGNKNNQVVRSLHTIRKKESGNTLIPTFLRFMC
jgi:hypothetical protein